MDGPSARLETLNKRAASATTDKARIDSSTKQGLWSLSTHFCESCAYGFTTTPCSRLIRCSLSRIKKKKGRSAMKLNFGRGGAKTHARVIVTAVEAAASVPNSFKSMKLL